MTWILVAIVLLVVLLLLKKQKSRPDLSVLPKQFVVFDLETTGLKSASHEIIEIGAIRVDRDSDEHDGFEVLIKPKKKVPKRITELTGITQEMLEKHGKPLEIALQEFVQFMGQLPLVSFNSDFDMMFLRSAIDKALPNHKLPNRVSCALKMARRAWPGRSSYRLADLARDGGLSPEGTHRALGDCKRALIVYTAAASRLGRCT